MWEDANIWVKGMEELFLYTFVSLKLLKNSLVRSATITYSNCKTVLKESLVPDLGRPTLDFLQGPGGSPNRPSGNFVLEITCQVMQLNLCLKN